MSSQLVSRTTCASLTRLRCGSCQAKTTMNQCCSTCPISLAYSSHNTRQGFSVRHSSITPSDFQSLESNSICHRSREPHQHLLKTQSLAWHVGQQDRPVRQSQGLLGNGLPASLRI